MTEEKIVYEEQEEKLSGYKTETPSEYRISLEKIKDQKKRKQY